MTHSAKPHKRALLIRIDRIGDLVLTLPVDQGLGVHKADWWIPQGLSFVTQAASPRRTAIEVERKITLKRFIQLLSSMKNENYDLAIVFHAPWWVSLMLWLARVPIRVGVKSQWHSFLFFNRAVRQKRSKADQSELEFNYRLVEQGLQLPIGTLPRTSLELKASSPTLPGGLLNRGYTVVHPGMSGSARNWPETHYAKLISRLTERGTVVITGTKSDESFLAPLRATLGEMPGVLWLDGKLKGNELIDVLAGARCIVAPSTGVAHLAASTGSPIVGIYSPVRVQRALRWRPQGKAVAIADPAVDCPGELKCLGTACPHWDCMKTVSVDEVLSKIEAFERP